MRLYHNGTDTDSISHRLLANYDLNTINRQIEDLNRLYYNEGIFRTDSMRSFEWKSNTVKELGFLNLWLNISHDCNLRCRYCFGHGGNYGGKRELMTEETAKKCIDFWLDNLSVTKEFISVTFFGGEPLLNKRTLQFAINYINERLAAIQCKALFTITTNGTLLDDELIEIMKTNNIALLISIDGLREIQDRNRPYVNGRGSFEQILENINILKKHAKVFQGRITLTHQDVDALFDSVNFLWDIGFTDVLFEEVSIECTEMPILEEDVSKIKDTISKLTEITLDNILKGKQRYFTNVVRLGFQLHNRLLGNTCSLQAYNTLVFTPEGDIYRCHRLIDNKLFKLGSVWEETSIQQLRSSFMDALNHRECKDCWMKYLCGGGCGQENLIYNKNINKPYRIKCEIMKHTVKEAMKLYTIIYEHDRDLLEKFFSMNLKRERM